ncbi:MAG TPA: hypothetical protein EYP19_08055 [Desulfobacterales bacterium]|nr:hypothetical protein [Desulfobacterales bacterium]
MKKISIVLFASLLFSLSHAEERTAEQLVASKQKADMTYRQLMEIMGGASAMIHEGIIRENKQMVREGADIILNHPAPKHKPWTIMKEPDQEGFKNSLLTFDKILDTHAGHAADEAGKGNWLDASKAAHELTTSCITCHAMWKYKAK